MEEEQNQPRYAGILARFRETREKLQSAGKRRLSLSAGANKEGPEIKSAKIGHEDSNTKSSDVSEDVKGLEPLPQPEPVRAERRSKALEWMVEPTHIGPQESIPFSQIGLSLALQSTLESQGYERAFAVQAKVIPQILTAQRLLGPDPLPDILVNAPTGSGKTLAYSIPIVEMLQGRVVPKCRALVVVPTRPLLGQVIQVFESLIRGTTLTVMAMRADRALSRESALLNDHVADIIVATPGRLVDHLKTRPRLLESLEFLVVDEADRLLGQDFNDWTQELSNAVSAASGPVLDGSWTRPAQKLVFSATLTKDAGKLLTLGITSVPAPPKVYVLGHDSAQRDFSVPATLAETLMRIPVGVEKPQALVAELVRRKHLARTIVFVRSNEAASRLARLIHLIADAVYGMKIVCDRCSGELPVAERKRTLRSFAEGRIGVLVCTDLISRGIDVHGVDLVVNYDLPPGVREYVHRVGRTARAEASGSAWTLSSSSGERKAFWIMQNEVSRSNRIEVEQLASESDEDGDKKYNVALQQLESEVMGRV